MKKQIFSALAAGSLLLNIAGPALADTTIEISGNGSHSDNDASVHLDNSTTVVQDNNAKVTNNVSVNADTGDNKANDNTGGDVAITTGDADVHADVSNTLNKNAASVNCCGATGDTNVLISGNGTKSDNTVDLKEKSDTSVFQTNKADVYNNVDVNADTGDNKAKDNTGGDVTITTGDADAHVNVSTEANANWANVGPSGNGQGQLSARIVGNGSHSDNDIKLTLDKDITLVQDNWAKVSNWVDVDADTGDNKANDNTGGDVAITTGDAHAKVVVDNLVNFNWANVDCGCLLDVTAKVAGNGTDSDNDIKAKLSDDRSIFQDNWADLANWADVDADTGDNKAKDNTGPVHGDSVSVDTGDADMHTDVSNSGNVNSFGTEAPVHFPGVDFGFSLHFDLNDLLGLLGLV